MYEYTFDQTERVFTVLKPQVPVMVPPSLKQLGPELPAVLPEKLFAGKSVRNVALPP